MSEVRWTEPAARDLEEAGSYIQQFNAHAAAQTLRRIQAAASNLSHFPYSGRPGRVAGTRELVVTGTPYLVAYRHDPAGDEIAILAVLHGAREWPDTF